MSSYSSEAMHVLRVLGDRGIAYHPGFAKAGGMGVMAAVLLSQLIYWHDKQDDPDGWIRKTVAELSDELSMTEREQESARATLKALGIIEYERRGMPYMPHYRVDFDELMMHVLALPVRTKRPNKIGRNVLTSEDIPSGRLIGRNVLAISESTSESTTHTGGGAQGARVCSDSPLQIAPLSAQSPEHVSAAESESANLGIPNSMTTEQEQDISGAAHNESRLSANSPQAILGVSSGQGGAEPLLSDRPAPERKLDGLVDMFERATQPKSVAASIRNWKCGADVVDMCVAVHEVTGLAPADGKTAKGQWTRGARDLIDAHASRDDIQAGWDSLPQSIRDHCTSPLSVYKATVAAQARLRAGGSTTGEMSLPIEYPDKA